MALPFYETDRALSEYLLFHYGTDAEVLPWSFGPVAALHYSVRCVSECLRPEALPPRARALDLGCAVGRSSFELARHCSEVIGIDYSHRFIQAAQSLQRDGVLRYRFVEEGELITRAEAIVSPESDRRRVRFEQGDAQALRADLGSFEVVLMANLVDRLPQPRACLARLPDLVSKNGQLILTTPCTWLEEYTPRVEWLGGFEQDGRPLRSLDGLRRQLEPAFALTGTRELPFLIREHARKYQWSVAQASLWTRR